jgi:aspartyl protease family protein
MGLNDRDYYRGKYKAQPPGSRIRKSGRNSTGIKYLLYPLLSIAVLWYGANILPDKLKELTLIPTPIVARKEKLLDLLVSGGITLKTDRQGHFRGTALVNNIPMPFLIDTGATKTVIPTKMAIAASLPFGHFTEANTAGGKVVERETSINSLKIGNAIIKNLNANINDHLDEVLIGMNTLKYFHMTQRGDTLTLVANKQQVQPIQPITKEQVADFDTFPMQQLIKKPVTLKKTVTCNERKVCKTTYSDR